MIDSEEERWQSYDANGEPARRALTKPEARSGILHGVAHVWVWRSGGNGAELLLQRRAADKPTWPNHLDISAAGHIDFGETPLVAALRETREELGLELKPEQLTMLFVYHSRMADGAVIEDEFQWVYGCGLTSDTKMEFADSEVAAVTWLSLTDLRALTKRDTSEYPLVPHGDVYFANLLAELAQVLAGK